ncbi:hypothetical protein M2451_003904, partial [Dysgonomonas sp. PFB1-18]|nr:hypothetical protein [Dysgonomonas sp. PFB1-18]
MDNKYCRIFLGSSRGEISFARNYIGRKIFSPNSNE